ncbi:heme oxygenase 1 [Hordeum vulgare]|nr:heme oxygenase 1 [Hordeum vulgare]
MALPVPLEARRAHRRGRLGLPDCGGEGVSPSSSPPHAPTMALGGAGGGSGLVAAIREIEADATLSKQGMAQRRQELDKNFSCVFCMKLPERPVTDEAGTAAIKTVELDSVLGFINPKDGEFQNTGLERSEALKKDLKCFIEQGRTIPEPSAADTRYACYLEELSEKDQHAFFCHFYNMYFGKSARGRFTDKKIADKILNKKELEFYKWEGTLSDLLQNVRKKLNQVGPKAFCCCCSASKDTCQAMDE